MASRVRSLKRGLVVPEYVIKSVNRYYKRLVIHSRYLHYNHIDLLDAEAFVDVPNLERL